MSSGVEMILIYECNLALIFPQAILSSHRLHIPEFSEYSFVPKHFFLNAFDFEGAFTIRKGQVGSL